MVKVPDAIHCQTLPRCAGLFYQLCLMYNELMVNRLSFRDALSLSWKNINQHKGRSVIIILTIAILFGLLMGVNFVLRGLEVSALNASVTNTGGVAYVSSSYQNPLSVSESKVTSDVLARIQKYGGENVGRSKAYKFISKLNTYDADYQTIQVVDSSVVQDFIIVDLSEVPEGKIPVLAPEGGFNIKGESPSADWLRKEIADKYYVVGYLPILMVSTAMLQMSELGIGNEFSATLPGFNLLNLFLGDITTGDSTGMEPMLVDDGSGVVSAYLDEKITAWRKVQQEQLGEWEVRDEPLVGESAIAVFRNPLDVIGYTAVDMGSGINIGGFVSNSSSVAQVFHMNWLGVMVIEVIVLVVAIVIATFTFAHLVDQDANTIALYRSMGATAGNIYLIYFLYLLELCLMALAASCLLGLAISGVTAWTDAGALAEKWQEFWVLDELPKVVLFGIDWHFWMVVIAMLLIAPVSLIFVQGRFSAKHVVKQLKED